MAKVTIDDYEFDIPNKEYTENELRQEIGRRTASEPKGVIVDRKNGYDEVVAPGDRINVGKEDQLTMVSPFEAAGIDVDRSSLPMPVTQTAMKTVRVTTPEGYDFEIPQGRYTGRELLSQGGAEGKMMPVVRQKDKDMLVEPDEVIDVGDGDRVVYTSPMEAACSCLMPFFSRKAKNDEQQAQAKRPGSSRTSAVTMVIKASDWTGIREHLLRLDGKERVSFILFGAAHDDPSRVYVHRVVNLADDEYERQTPVYVVPAMQVQLNIFRRFETDGIRGIMHVHSHPFTKIAEFSGTDNESIENAVKSLRNYLKAGKGKPSKPFSFGRMVVGRDEAGFSGDIRDSDSGNQLELEQVRVMGRKTVRNIRSIRSRGKVDSWTFDREILDRNIKWLGEDGQRKLTEGHLAICGVGGAGAMVAQSARGMGFGKITLIDHDTIEKSNLNRLPGASLQDVGSYKVHVMKQMILDVATGTDVVALPYRLESEEATRALKSADIIVGAVDSFKSRFDLQLLAARLLIPMVDIGSGITIHESTGKVRFMGGQVGIYMPGGPCLCCQAIIPHEIDSDLSVETKRATGYVQGTDITPTAVVTINSIMAGHAMDSVIKLLSGFSPIKPYVRCDLLNGSYQLFNFEKRSDCPICGSEGIEGRGEEEELLMAREEILVLREDQPCPR